VLALPSSLTSLPRATSWAGPAAAVGVPGSVVVVVVVVVVLVLAAAVVVVVAPAARHAGPEAQACAQVSKPRHAVRLAVASAHLPGETTRHALGVPASFVNRQSTRSGRPHTECRRLRLMSRRHRRGSPFPSPSSRAFQQRAYSRFPAASAQGQACSTAASSMKRTLPGQGDEARQR
jgi:hypothetical protein